MMTTAYIAHPDCLLHDIGERHPERAARLNAINDYLLGTGLLDFLHRVDAPRATDEQLLRVHTRQHLDQLKRLIPTSGVSYIDPDTYVVPRSLDAAYRAAGAIVKATELVLEGEVTNAFCAIRPPGHHAESQAAMGFCLLNNVAVGAAHALVHDTIERVAIVDFDVHHGNGTEEIFSDNPAVLYCSTYQSHLFPHAETDIASMNMLHSPLEPHSGGDSFKDAVRETWLPKLNEFRPQIVFVSAGFDAHYADHLASLNLTEVDFRWITLQLMEVAADHSDARLVSTLEGGYALDALAKSCTEHIRCLMGLNN